MITAAMERRLIELGVSVETIRQLKPDEAWTLLTRVDPVHPLGQPGCSTREARRKKAAAAPPDSEQER
jgi:hypothetical protein